MLFIDGLRTIVGADEGGGHRQPAQAALARGELHAVSATARRAVSQAYREGHAALARRFQPNLRGASGEDTISILHMILKEKYERHHGVDHG